ncbi:Molybdenum cofactor sulfurtransferase [Bertholletia excelsa]
MGKNAEEQIILSNDSKAGEEDEFRMDLPKSPSIQTSRPSSMVVKKAHTVIPAHLIAEAISNFNGLDLRWSGPITPSEMQYVRQYIFAKYPEYRTGLVEESNKIEVYSICSLGEDSAHQLFDEKPKSLSPAFLFDLDRTQLEPSRLLDMISKKSSSSSSSRGHFVSIPEIQVRNRALQLCGLAEEEYLVVFAPSCREAMMMIGESYPFFRGNYYLTIIAEEQDCIREFVICKDSKVVAAPETWLDLRIKGSQLSQYFRRKCKHSPKGLFSYPFTVNGGRASMHWISEAHRNSWHVLLDATGIGASEDRLALALHRPDFVVCAVDNTHPQPPKITCLIVRRQSFKSMTISD